MSHVPAGHGRNLVPASGSFGHGRDAEAAWLRNGYGPIGHGRNLVPDVSEGDVS